MFGHGANCAQRYHYVNVSRYIWEDSRLYSTRHLVYTYCETSTCVDHSRIRPSVLLDETTGTFGDTGILPCFNIMISWHIVAMCVILCLFRLHIS